MSRPVSMRRIDTIPPPSRTGRVTLVTVFRQDLSAPTVVFIGDCWRNFLVLGGGPSTQIPNTSLTTAIEYSGFLPDGIHLAPSTRRHNGIYYVFHFFTQPTAYEIDQWFFK